MRKLLKFCFYGVIVFFGVFLILIAVVPLFFDPNDYKFVITQIVRKQTGRELDIEGDLKLQILPKLAVNTGKIRLGNPPGFSQNSFAEIESGYFRVKLLPLFSKQVEIKKVVLDGVKLNLIRREDGRTNWSGLTKTAKPAGAGPIPIESNIQPPQMSTTENSSLAAIFATKFDILNTEIDFEDRKSKNRLVLKDLNIIIDRFDFSLGTDFKIEGTLTNSNPRIRESMVITGQLFVNEKLDRFSILGLNWHSNTEADFIPKQFSKLFLQSKIDLDLAKNTLKFSNTQIRSGKASLSADLSAANILKKPILDGQITIEQLDPRTLLQVAHLSYQPQDSNALSTMNGKFSLRYRNSLLVLKNIALNLDDNRITGQVRLDLAKSPSAQFNFSLNEFDADRYLPPADPMPSSTPEPAGPPPGITVVEAEPVPASQDKNADSSAATIKGALNLGRLRFHGLLAEQVQVAVLISNGVIRSNQRFNQFYGGQLRGSLEYNPHGIAPLIALNQTLTGVQAGSLLRDLKGKESLDGTLNTTIRLVGRGKDFDSIKSTLNGDIHATVTKGQIHGVSLDQIIRNSKNLISQTGLIPESALDITKFSKLICEATVVNGIIDNSVLKVNSTNFDFNGSGTIDLPNDRVNYRIEALVNDNPAGILGIKIKELKGVRVPIEVTGTLSDLTFQPGVRSALDDPRVKSAAKKLQKKLEQHLPSETRQLLENLF